MHSYCSTARYIYTQSLTWSLSKIRLANWVMALYISVLLNSNEKKNVSSFFFMH